MREAATFKYKRRETQMKDSIDRELIERGVRISDSRIFQQDKIWSRYSNDKVDIGEELAKVIRVLNKELPLTEAMRALSIGSSTEPQFRILEAAFRGGLYLLDLEEEALDVVEERIRRQHTDHVVTIHGDYRELVLNSGGIQQLLEKNLNGKEVNLITLHHSLYYCEEEEWQSMLSRMYRYVLSPAGAMHIVLMAAESEDQYTTTWLYNHFVEKFFGLRNNQNLLNLKGKLESDKVFEGSQIIARTNHVRFFVDDFEKFMAVVWMILLYPNVHVYSEEQKEEVTEFVHDAFWKRKQPLVQPQDHVVVYKGMRGRELI